MVRFLKKDPLKKRKRIPALTCPELVEGAKSKGLALIYPELVEGAKSKGC
jgi:hypothetical protein